jgi:hypothetical protein
MILLVNTSFCWVNVNLKATNFVVRKLYQYNMTLILKGGLIAILMLIGGYFRRLICYEQ